MEELRKTHKEMLPAYKYRLDRNDCKSSKIHLTLFTKTGLAEFGLTHANHLAHNVNQSGTINIYPKRKK